MSAMEEGTSAIDGNDSRELELSSKHGAKLSGMPEGMTSKRSGVNQSLFRTLIPICEVI